MVWPLIVRGLMAAGPALWRLARNPSVRKAAIDAAKKAEGSFSRFGKKAAQTCAKSWRAIRGRSINVSEKALQKKFKHARDFGVDGNYSPANAARFRRAVEQHVANPATRIIEGTYRGAPVRHYVDPTTGLNVIKDVGGNFVSGWRLSAEQLKHVLRNGALGGG